MRLGVCNCSEVVLYNSISSHRRIQTELIVPFNSNESPNIQGFYKLYLLNDLEIKVVDLEIIHTKMLNKFLLVLEV